jgi:hypothetical protein
MPYAKWFIWFRHVPLPEASHRPHGVWVKGATPYDNEFDALHGLSTFADDGPFSESEYLILRGDEHPNRVPKDRNHATD